MEPSPQPPRLAGTRPRRLMAAVTGVCLAALAGTWTIREWYADHAIQRAVEEAGAETERAVRLYAASIERTIAVADSAVRQSRGAIRREGDAVDLDRLLAGYADGPGGIFDIVALDTDGKAIAISRRARRARAGSIGSPQRSGAGASARRPALCRSAGGGRRRRNARARRAKNFRRQGRTDRHRHRRADARDFRPADRPHGVEAGVDRQCRGRGRHRARGASIPKAGSVSARTSPPRASSRKPWNAASRWAR